MIEKHTPGSQLAPHQFFVNSSQRQLWCCARLQTARATSQLPTPRVGIIIPLQLLSQRQTLADEFFVIFLQRCRKEMSFSHVPLSVSVCLGREALCDPLCSALISLIQNALSCCLPLVLGDLNCKHGFDRNDKRVC